MQARGAMPILTILTGALLCLIGVVGFVATGMQHFTSLIPFALGDIMIASGVLAQVRPTWRMHTMHAAATMALLGVLGSVRGTVKAVAWLSGAAPEYPAAVLAQTATAVLCAVFLGLAIRSFIAARKARQAASATTGT